MTKKQCAAPTTSSTSNRRRHGGEVVATGQIAEIVANPNSLTGRCLKHPMIHLFRGSAELVNAPAWIEVAGARLPQPQGSRCPLSHQSADCRDWDLGLWQEHSRWRRIAGSRQGSAPAKICDRRTRLSAPETTHPGAHTRNRASRSGLGGRSISDWQDVAFNSRNLYQGL